MHPPMVNWPDELFGCLLSQVLTGEPPIYMDSLGRGYAGSIVPLNNEPLPCRLDCDTSIDPFGDD